MKKYLLVLGVVAAVFSCGRVGKINPDTCLPVGWLPMDTAAVFESFIPRSVSVKAVTYKSATGETRTFEAIGENTISNSMYEYYTTYCLDYGTSKSANKEEIHVGNHRIFRTQTHDIALSCTFWIFSRYEFGADFYYQDLDSSFTPGNVPAYSTRAIFRKEFGCYSNYQPKHPNAVLDFMNETDTIYMKNLDDNQVKAVLVKGKGLVWFLDHKGVKWTLQE